MHGEAQRTRWSKIITCTVEPSAPARRKTYNVGRPCDGHSCSWKTRQVLSEKAWPSWSFVMKANAGAVDQQLSEDMTSPEIRTDVMSDDS